MMPVARGEDVAEGVGVIGTNSPRACQQADEEEERTCA
jgi:hypothetical protein